MMKLTHIDLDTHLLMNSGFFYNITLLNKKMYYDFINSLINQIKNDDTRGFVLSEDDNELSMKQRCKIILNPFYLSVVDRKDINLLYKNIKDQLASKDIQNILMDFESKFNQLMNDIVVNIDFDIDYDDEIDILSLFKFANIYPNIIGETCLERLVKYILFKSRNNNVYIFFTLNLNSVLTTENLKLFIKEMNLHKINIINIESFDYNIKIKENYCKITVDEDLFEFSSFSI